jgi:hypothetical protein
MARIESDYKGFPIVAPFVARKITKVTGKRQLWPVYGHRAGVSATVLCRADSRGFALKRDALALAKQMES